MRIQINHTVRDMTDEEIEALDTSKDDEPTIEDKAEAYDILMGEEESE